MRIGFALVVAGACLTQLGCALKGQAPAHAGRFAGDWLLSDATGAQPPKDLAMSVERSGDRLTMRATWGGSTNGPQGLTLTGVVTPRLTLDASGREAGAQIGPYVLRHTSRWEHDRLVTRWSTSEYMGSRLSGTWIRSLSNDGATMTLEIDAVSSSRDAGRARLIFRRK